MPDLRFINFIFVNGLNIFLLFLLIAVAGGEKHLVI